MLKLTHRKLTGLRFNRKPKLQAIWLSTGSVSEYSWLNGLHVGDDQGDSSACAVFTCAKWAEAMKYGVYTDAECKEVWRITTKNLGRPGDGLTPEEAVHGCSVAGMLPKRARAVRRYNLSALARQPLFGAYKITPAFQNVSPEGCLDHSASTRKIFGYHAMLIVAQGILKGQEILGPVVENVNHWNEDWGYKGMCVSTQHCHNNHCVGVWSIELEDAA